MSGMTFAYADPPYLGNGAKHYSAHHADAARWDTLSAHAELIADLVRDYPDGWALSASSPSLRHLLPLCPPATRVAAWVKPFCALKRNVRPAYAWEPVLFAGGRNRNHPPPPKGGKATTPKDFVIGQGCAGCPDCAPALACNITLRKGLTGAKPPAFCDWVLDLLNVQPGDTVVDLFPGTGIFGQRVAERLGERRAS